MKLFETSGKAAQLRLRLRIRWFIIERGPPDEFGSRNLARLAFRSMRALSFAVIGTTNLCVARLIRASYEGHYHIHDQDDTG